MIDTRIGNFLATNFLLNSLNVYQIYTTTMLAWVDHCLVSPPAEIHYKQRRFN